MDWLRWAAITAQNWDPSQSPNHSGFVPHGYTPADKGPEIWSPPLGPNSVGNWIMFGILILAALTGATAATKAGPFFGALVLLAIIGGIVIAASGKYGHF